MDSIQGPILAIAGRDQYEDVVLGFEIVGYPQGDKQGQSTVNTNWPRRYSFPNFWLNVIQYLASGATGQDSPGCQPGESVELSPSILGKIPVSDSPGAVPGLAGQGEAGKSKLNNLEVVLPDGTVRALSPPQQGKYVFHETQLPGIYEVRASSQRLYRFAVNLLDPHESDIRLRVSSGDEEGLHVVDSISIGYVDIAAQAQTAAGRHELWKWLLLAALVVLVIEWYIFNRRVYV